MQDSIDGEDGLLRDVSLEATRRFLYRHLGKEVKLVVLVIDADLSIDARLFARIMPLLIKEVNAIIEKYGGYLLKYVGGLLVTFFSAEFDERKACINALAASKEILDVINKRINPDLEERSYPRLDIKASVNFGSDLVIAYDNSYDLAGSTIRPAMKILRPSRITATESVYQFYNKLNVGDKLYELGKEELKMELDGKAIIYRAIDEVDSDNPSTIIKEALKIAIKEGYEKDICQTIVIALMHFILSKFMIPSERKVEVDNQILDIVIPSSRVLKKDPDNALILAFPDDKSDISKLSKLQPNKDNIWLIYGYPATSDYRVYLPDQFAGRPLSSIIDDITNFMKNRNVKGFKILPS